MSHKNNTMRCQAGFTLVEIIITILIIAVLLSVAVTQFSDMSDAAKRAKCKNNQMTIDAAQRIYYMERAMNGHPEYAPDINSLIPYLKNDDLPDCPTGGQYSVDADGDASCTDPDHQR